MARTYGAAGRMAAAFIHSKLTPLFILASMALGALAVVALPREEEPQIIVPMVDVFVQMPGATPADVEQRVTRPMEQLLWEVPGVEYVYSTSSPGQSMVVVRFKVGEPQEAALVRLNQKLAANADRIPPGVIGPIVKPRSIDDVPILAVTVWSARYADDQLRSLAAQLRDAIAEVTDVSEVTLIGGRPRQVRVDIDPARLSAYDLDPLSVQQAIARTNVRGAASGPVAGGVITGLEAGSRLRTADDLRHAVVTSARGRPVLVRDVADVVDGDAEPTSYVTFQSKTSGAQPAVTIAVAKRKGTNAIDVARRVAAEARHAEGNARAVRRAPHHHPRLRRDRRRQEQRTAVAHAARRALGVGADLAGARPARGGRRADRDSGHARADAVHVLSLRLHAEPHHALRADLLHRHPGGRRDRRGGEHRAARASDRTARRDGLAAIALRAVDEVGNPTILATLAVVAAILPMAFVGGLMGPYMRPIPVGASAAMVFSLVVAFVVTPWAAVRLLKPAAHHDHGEEDLFTRLYRRVMGPLIASGRMRALFLAGVAALLLAAMALVPLELVTVKMLPFDNKSEFQVMVDMPEGTALETTARVASALAVGHAGGRDRRQRAAVRRHVGAVQLQRPRAALLPAPRAAPGRPAGEPRAEGRAVGAEPRRGRTRARPAGCRSRTVRRHAAGGGGAAGTARPADPGRRSLRTGCGAADGGGRADQGDLRADARRGGHRLVRRGAAPEDHARGRRREGRGGGPLVGGRGVGRSGWPARENPRACCTTNRRAKTCRSSFACRATIAVSRPSSRSGCAGPGRWPWASSPAP